MNVQSLVTWVGIAGALAGIGFPAYSTHKQDQAEIAAERQKEVQHAVQEQMEHDRLKRRLDEYDRHLALLDENLPEQTRRIARAMFAQMQAQQDTQVLYEKSSPQINKHRMAVLAPVAADAPAASSPPQ